MLKRLTDTFDIEYPKTMIYSEQTEDQNGIFFVSSSGANNGIVGRIARTTKNKLYKKGAITVPLKGSVLEAFYQSEDFYIAHQIAVLYPKRTMDESELLFYCACIRKNKYRYSYGRQADRTLKDILVPAEIPPSFRRVHPPQISRAPFHTKKLALTDRKWEWFEYQELFDIEIGKGPKTIQNTMVGKTRFISTTSENNGIATKLNTPYEHDSGSITVSNDGSVGEAFYQDQPFASSYKVNVLQSKFELNKFIAMFLVALIKKEKYRYSYGRKWGIDRMKQSKIRLPITPTGTPDWQFMEDFIKSLPYSKAI